MSDLISRQAAIDLIMEIDPWWCEGVTRAIFEGIKELPDALPPHGRLIDADALAKSIKDQIELVKLFQNEELDRIAQIIEVGYMQEIAKAPTIIEAEIKNE